MKNKLQVATRTMHLNKELYNRFIIHKLHLNIVAWIKVVVMPRVRKNAYQHVSGFDGVRTVVDRVCGLLY